MSDLDERVAVFGAENWAVKDAVLWAVLRGVNGIPCWAVDDAVDRSVSGAVRRAVVDAVGDTLAEDVLGPDHPAFQDYLEEAR